MDRRKYLRLAGATGAAGIAGCIGGNGGSSGQTIHFLNDRAARDTWESAVEEFNSESDYTVEITWLAKGNSVDEQLAKMKAAGNMPAMAFKNTEDAYRETVEGDTAPVTETVSNLDLPDMVSIDGESYLVPIVSIPATMTYRKDIVEGEPRTREEWQAEAERIQSETDMNGYVVPTGRTNLAEVHTVQTLWNSNVDIYSGSGENIDIIIDEGENRERAIETFEWLQEMNNLGPQASGWGWGDGVGALIQESLAGWAGIGGLAIQEINNNRPEISDQFGHAPYPISSDDEQSNWWRYTEGFLIYNEANHLDGARNFIEHFMESDHYWEFMKQTAPFNLPVTREGLDNEEFTSAEAFEGHQGFLDMVRENWDQMGPVVNTGDDGTPNLTATQSYNVQMFGQAVDQMLYNDRSPEETIDWLAEELRNL